MEETKCRLALEAEVQELRMRLSGVEAVARSPLVHSSTMDHTGSSASGWQTTPNGAPCWPPRSTGWP